VVNRVPQPVKEFPSVVLEPKIHYRVHKSSPLVPFLPDEGNPHPFCLF